MAKLQTRDRKEVIPSEEKEPGHRWHSMREYQTALEKSGGFFTIAARLLGVSVSAVSQKVAKSEYLQNICQRVTEENLKLAVDKLIEAVKNGEGWAIQYILRTKGRRYGYGEGLQLEAEIHQTIKAGCLVVPGMMKIDDWERMVKDHYQKRRQENAEQAQIEHKETIKMEAKGPSTRRRYQIVEEIEQEIQNERLEQIDQDDGGTYQVDVTRG